MSQTTSHDLKPTESVQNYKWRFANFLTNEGLTEKQRDFMEAVFNRAKGEIQLDILLGILPDSLRDYDDLGLDIEQPGDYGGRNEEPIMRLGEALFPVDKFVTGSLTSIGGRVVYQEACAAITERLHQWLLSRSKIS